MSAACEVPGLTLPRITATDERGQGREYANAGNKQGSGSGSCFGWFLLAAFLTSFVLIRIRIRVRRCSSAAKAHRLRGRRTFAAAR